MIFRRALLAVALIATAGMVAAACGDDADTAGNPSQAGLDAINERIQRNEMMVAVLELGRLGLHSIDESLSRDERIESHFVPNTRTAIRVLALTNWTSEFEEDAHAVREHAEALLAALQDGDIEAAKEHATDLHESEHDFSSAVWDHLAAEIGEAGDDHSEDEEAQ